ncbi:MAG: hypothetical protein ACOC5L_01480 [Halobacteriota archaeon]
MIWNYRAINNPVARKKWLLFGIFLLIIAMTAGASRYVTTGELGRSLIITGILLLFIFLYIQIVLGKPRQYFIDDEDRIHYKPFKTDLKQLKGYRIDADSLKIDLELQKSSPFAVKTLYFEDIEDLKEAQVFLNKYVDKNKS